MDKIIIAKMGIEGGGCTIYGQQVDGGWSFWRAGTSMDFDENDNEVWRQWESEPVANLLDALPKKWWCMYTSRVHADFEQQLRQAFDQYRDQPDWDEHRFNPW
jgi:hypothetical protein